MALVDGDEFDRWRAPASETRAAAKTIHTSGSFAWCCFLAEQAAQLGVTRIMRGIGRPSDAFGHDLVTLVARAGTAVGSPIDEPTIADAAARLARHYIPARYPDAHAAGSPADHYRDSDAATALADADAVLGAIDTAWTDLLESADDADGDEAGQDSWP